MTTNPKQFQTMLTLFQHSLPQDAQVNLFKQLQPFGNTANKAMARYMANPPSGFFDWSALMKCLRTELLLEAGLPQPEAVWGFITKEILRTPLYAKITWPPVVGDVVKQLGGAMAVRNNTNEVSMRSRAIAAYQTLLDDFLTEYIVSKWQQ